MNVGHNMKLAFVGGVVVIWMKGQQVEAVALGTIWTEAPEARIGGMLMWMAVVVGGPTDAT